MSERTADHQEAPPEKKKKKKIKAEEEVTMAMSLAETTEKKSEKLHRRLRRPPEISPENAVVSTAEKIRSKEAEEAEPPAVPTVTTALNQGGCVGAEPDQVFPLFQKKKKKKCRKELRSR